jgi:hypothetical protein
VDVGALGAGAGVVDALGAGAGVLDALGAGAGVLDALGAGAGVVDALGAGAGVLDALGAGAGGLGPAGRRGAVDWARMADSNRLNASLVSPARASAAPAICSLKPAEDPPDSLALRAARQIGHHWHSGGSSVGSVVVASSQTSRCDVALPPPIVDFTRSVTSLVMLRAPAFISQRWKSPNGSLPGCSLILAA